MNWFGFASGREELLVSSRRNESSGHESAPDDVASGARPVPIDALSGMLRGGDALPAGLAPRVQEALAEVAARHPGSLRIVEALATEAPGGAAVVVVVERSTAAEPTADEVARRFGLTRRQATVALLLARRHSNAEIARLLAVSPHTARHHTERVLERLGVTSRMQVAALLLGGR